MRSFLRNTAESLLHSIRWEQLRNTVLVLPSHRAGLVLKNELLRLQQECKAKAVWAPQVLTLTQLQDSLSPLYSEDELFTIARLYKHYRRLNAGDNDLMPLDLFYGWGRQMLADFTNIDASMPAEQVPNFFDNTIAAHELSQWQLDAEVEERLRSLMRGEGVPAPADDKSIKAQYEHLWRQLYELYQSLHNEMAAEQKGYAGMRQRSVIEEWEGDSVQSKIAGKTYVFVGFNYLLPVERELMERLRDSQQALFYWDYVADFQTNEKAFSFAKQNRDILDGEHFDACLDEQEPKQVTVVSCVSREAQAQFVHRWLRENYTQRGQKTGVVICDETMLESVIYTLPAITLPGEQTPEPVNITKGFPLRNTEIYSRVLHWLNDSGRGKADTLVSPDFIEQMLAELFPENTENTTPTEEVEQLNWKELLILESEYQVRKIANQMRLLLSNGLGDVAFTLKLLRLLMRRTMESVTMPFHGEPITDIQIMGVLETRMLDFDRLLLLNVEEGVVPQRQKDISFIPFYLRKAYHMQTSDERATVYAYNFFRLLSRAHHSTMLYASAETAEGGKGMSRFIMQILASPEFNVQKTALQEPSVISTFSDESDELNEISLLSMLQTDEQGVVRRKDGSRFRLSPSALNTYISCPRSFYLQYLIGLKPKDEEEALFAPSTMGSFVHHAMEYIYRTYLNCNNATPVRVLPGEIEAIRKDDNRLQQALKAAYDAMNALWAKDHPDETEHYVADYHAGENIVILGYVDNILECDQKDAETGLQIYLLEQERNFSIHIDGVGQILTGGTIDRLDIYGTEGNQVLRVIDYKSGSYGDDTHKKKMCATWENIMADEDKGYVRQTLIYSHAVQQWDKTQLPIEPHLYFCRRKVAEIETTIELEGAQVSDYKAIQETFYNALRAKTQEILTTTSFPKCDSDKCPSFCPFFDLCGRKPKEF